MFEKASKLKLRFVTVQGPASTEDLWNLPLTSKNRASLNGVAKTIAKELREADEEDFVDSTPANTELELKLAIVKHVIAYKKAAKETATTAAATKERNATIMGIIAKKQTASLEDKTVEELMAEIK